VMFGTKWPSLLRFTYQQQPLSSRSRVGGSILCLI
jgi:hypothetical protein